MVFNKAFDDIDYSDIQSLIGKVAERQNIEYKQQVWEHNDKETREMLRDISSMANAFGGYIIVGVRADQDGLPIEIINISNAEMERDRIWSSCISCLESRIPGLKIKTISLPERESLIIIFIPRSTRLPHMVTFKGLNQFWIRHDRQKSPMSIEEIREACLRVENLQKNVQDFIKERKEEILNVISNKTVYLIAAVPLATRSAIIDINDKILRDFLKNPPGQRKHGWNLDFTGGKYGSPNWPKPTLQGLVIGSLNWRKVELWRNGYYELLAIIDGERYLRKVRKTEKYFFTHLPIIELTVSYFRALKVLRQLIGVEESIIGCVTIFNVSKIGFVCHINEIGDIFPDEVEYYSKPHLEVKPVAIYDQHNPDKVAKEFLGRIWNAFGFESEDVPFFRNDEFHPPS